MFSFPCGEKEVKRSFIDLSSGRAQALTTLGFVIHQSGGVLSLSPAGDCFAFVPAPLGSLRSSASPESIDGSGRFGVIPWCISLITRSMPSFILPLSCRLALSMRTLSCATRLSSLILETKDSSVIIVSLDYRVD